MAIPLLVWGVFQIGARVAASAAGRQAIKYVVKKITPKIVKKYGDPVSKHKTAEVATKVAKNKTVQAKKAAEKVVKTERQKKAADARAKTKKFKEDAKKRGDARRAKAKNKRQEDKDEQVMGQARTGFGTATKPRRMTPEEVASVSRSPRLGGRKQPKSRTDPSPLRKAPKTPKTTKTAMRTAVTDIAKDPRFYTGITLAGIVGAAMPKKKKDLSTETKKTGESTTKTPPETPTNTEVEKAKKRMGEFLSSSANRTDSKAKAEPKPPITNKELGAHYNRINTLIEAENKGAGTYGIKYKGKEYRNWKEYNKAWEKENKGRDKPEDPVKSFFKGAKKKITGEKKRGGGQVSSRPKSYRTAKIMKQYAKGGSVRKPNRI
jgi:hypothetical protein